MAGVPAWIMGMIALGGGAPKDPVTWNAAFAWLLWIGVVIAGLALIGHSLRMIGALLREGSAGRPIG